MPIKISTSNGPHFGRKYHERKQELINSNRIPSETISVDYVIKPEQKTSPN